MPEVPLPRSRAVDESLLTSGGRGDIAGFRSWKWGGQKFFREQPVEIEMVDKCPRCLTLCLGLVACVICCKVLSLCYPSRHRLSAVEFFAAVESASLWPVGGPTRSAFPYVAGYACVCGRMRLVSGARPSCSAAPPFRSVKPNTPRGPVFILDAAAQRRQLLETIRGKHP